MPEPFYILIIKVLLHPLITAFTSRHFVCSVELDIFIGNRMDPAKIKQLKTQAHLLKPVIIIGQSGLTEAVQQEIEITLNTHELIKIKIRADRDERNQIREQILSQSKQNLFNISAKSLLYFGKSQHLKKQKHRPQKKIRPASRQSGQLTLPLSQDCT